MELQTRLKHIHSEADFEQGIEENANVMICCGFMGLPFTIYFKNEAVVKATTSIQSQDQVEAILKSHY